jgi:hypothetical protein
MKGFLNKYSLAVLSAAFLFALPGTALAHAVGALVFYSLLFQFLIVISPLLSAFLKYAFCKRALPRESRISLQPISLVMVFEIAFTLAFVNAFFSYASKDFDMRIMNILSYLSIDAVFLYFRKAVIEHDLPWSMVFKFLIVFFALSLVNFFPNYGLISRYAGKCLNKDRRWAYSYFLGVISPAIFCLTISLLTLPAQHRDAQQYRSAGTEAGNIENRLLKRAASSGFLRLAAVAINEGANVNVADKYSNKTILHEAIAAQGNANTVKFLLQSGADPNRMSIYGLTPLMIACTRSKADPAIIDLLIKHGANINDRSIHGETALKIASRRNKGAWVEKYGIKGTAVEKMLLDYGAEVNIRDKNGATALMAASEAGNTDLISLLLDHGADVNIQDNQGKTAYMLTSDSAIKEILTKHGANPPS